MNSPASTLTAKDLVVGQVFDVGNYDVSRDEIIAFASHWDPLPIHIDPVAAAEGPFGDIVGSGAHMLAIMVRQCAIGVTLRSTVIAGRGVGGATFYRPLRPGTVTGRVVVEALVRRDRGDTLVTTRTELRNEQDELVCDLVGESIWT